MKWITRWIQENKAYSNPTFGSMLILSAMVFPVFQASARVVEPVQPIAQTAEQVVDAMKAIEAGVSANDAFNTQPVPFRKFVNFYATIYETLFDDIFHVSNSGYYLDDEINEADVFFDFVGTTNINNEFVIRFASLNQVDLTGGSLAPGDIASLAEHNSNILSFVGTISTAKSTLHIVGLVWQGTRLEDNERVRFLYILDTVDQSFIDDYEMVYFQPQLLIEETEVAEDLEPATPALDCAQALADAAVDQLADLVDEIEIYNTCTKNMSNTLIAELAICTSGGVGGTLLSRWIAPMVTAVGMGTCGIAATIRAQLALNTCFNTFQTKRNAIKRAYNRAVQNARDTYGEDCPGGSA